MLARSINFFMPSTKAVFENAALLRKILTWGRESSRQVQNLASNVGGGEQQRSCSPETSSQLQRYEMARYREEGTTHWIGIWPF